MTERLYRGDPRPPHERDEFERDLIAFSDRELDLLGDLRGRDVLYAGGTSPLWIEGLAERIGASGSLAVLDLDEGGIADAEESFALGDLPLRPRFVIGDVFDLPFEQNSFDLVYSSGLLHELDARRNGFTGLFREFGKVVVPGGDVAGSDFVDDVDAAQIEDEAIEAELLRLTTGAELFGIGSPRRILDPLESVFERVEYSMLDPFPIRHLDKLLLAEPEPLEIAALAPDEAERLSRRRKHLRERVSSEGYTRPATLFFRAGRSEAAPG